MLVYPTAAIQVASDVHWPAPMLIYSAPHAGMHPTPFPYGFNAYPNRSDSISRPPIPQQSGGANVAQQSTAARTGAEGGARPFPLGFDQPAARPVQRANPLPVYPPGLSASHPGARPPGDQRSVPRVDRPAERTASQTGPPTVQAAGEKVIRPTGISASAEASRTAESIRDALAPWVKDLSVVRRAIALEATPTDLMVLSSPDGSPSTLLSCASTKG